MVITEVEPLSRTRYKVYIDGKFAFVLYKGDLARYHLARGCEIPEETCRQIRREVVWPEGVRSRRRPAGRSAGKWC